MAALKMCPSCNIQKSLTEYHRGSLSDGTRTPCKACTNQANKARNRMHPEWRPSKQKHATEERTRRARLKQQGRIPKRISHYDAEAARQTRRRHRAEALTAYGSVCSCCGETESLFLTFDHKNGDGGRLRREKHHPRGGDAFYLWLKRNNWPEDFQVLCANCNLGRYLGGGVCPHAS